MSGISITDNGDGTATIVLPREDVPAVEQALFYKLRNQRVRARFGELRGRMKADDAVDLLMAEFGLSRSSIHKIVYGAEEG